MNSLSPAGKTKNVFLPKRRYQLLFVAVIALLYASLFYSISQALPTIQDKSTFRGARWVIDTGSRVKAEGHSPLRSMSFTGLDFFSDLHFGGRHRGDLVAQVYLFDMRTFPLNGDESKSRFDYAPCVIAPNLILLPQGRLNLKFGHLWHSYGLRNQINTTQTLRQLISQENMGLM